MTYDCTILGAGAAGLSAALVLGRARRSTLLIDHGGQSNLPAHAVGGLLGQHGTSPAELYAVGAAQLAELPTVERATGTVVGAERTDDGFAVVLEDGTSRESRTLLLALGAEYPRPALPGLEALWGTSVFHCPFCHGWEARDEAVGVLAAPAFQEHGARLMRAWADDVVLLCDGPAALDADARARVEAAGVTIDERPLAGTRLEDGRLAAVTFADGSELERTAVFAPAMGVPRTGLATALGATLTEQGTIEVDAMTNATGVPGLHAAGDLVLQGMGSVAYATASGLRAAAGVQAGLVFG